MRYSKNMMEEFVSLLEKNSPKERLNETGIPELVTYRESGQQGRCARVYEQGIAILGRGKKHCYVDGQKYDYSAGNYLALLLPMPIEVEVVEASAEEPLLMAGIRIDLGRIANILLKMDSVTQPTRKSETGSASSIFAKPLNDQLLGLILKLMRTLDNPIEQAVLGDSILDEIYFRLICDDPSGNLYRGLQHRGQVQEISKAVNHIHTHLSQPVSVDELAGMANMSTPSFRKIFREVMHMPPLQYAKKIKLDRAQRLILEGKKANEAGYLVGYNSPAQFSREYKRYFGFAPSAT
jgi:AraC-like DNA-binding protein